jgi:hypothetical protein
MRGFGAPVRERFLQHLRDGLQRGEAFDAVGVNRRKGREYIATHPAFEADVLDGELDALELVRSSLFQSALSGSVPASKAWLALNADQPSGTRSGASAAPVDDGPDPFADLPNVEPIRKKSADEGR